MLSHVNSQETGERVRSAKHLTTAQSRLTHARAGAPPPSYGREPARSVGELAATPRTSEQCPRTRVSSNVSCRSCVSLRMASWITFPKFKNTNAKKKKKKKTDPETRICVSPRQRLKCSPTQSSLFVLGFTTTLAPVWGKRER